MSKISIKIIENKLKELFAGLHDFDISRFNDETALNAIFSTYDDQLSFNDIIFERYIHEIQELNVVEMQLRAELKLVKDREREYRSKNAGGDDFVRNSRFEEIERVEQRLKQLQNICQAQEQELKEYEESKVKLEQKVLESTEKFNESRNQNVQNEQQLELMKEKDKENMAKIDELQSEKETIIKTYEIEIIKYKEEFNEQLTNTLKRKLDEDLQKSNKINQLLQGELKEQQEILKEVIHDVSSIFKITEPACVQTEVPDWLQALNAKVEFYRNEIKNATANDIKQTKNPIKKLTDHYKKQIQGREVMISKFLNK